MQQHFFQHLEMYPPRENKVAVINGKLGTGDDCTWKPWTYESRLENAAEVESFKQTLTKYAPSTQCTKVLNYMSKDLKTRQEFVPIIERLVDKAFADSFHNGNNGWQNFHSILLKEACQRAKLSTIPSDCTKKVHDLLRDNILRKFIVCLKQDLHAGRLYKKVCKWFRGGMKGLTYPSLLEPIAILQKKIMRSITFNENTTPTTHIFDTLQILKFNDVILLQITSFVYECLNNLAPVYFRDFFRSIHNVHDIGTCQSKRCDLFAL